MDLELGGLANAVSIEEHYIVVSPRTGSGRYEVDLLTTIAPGSAGVLNPASNVLTQWGLGAYAQGGVALEFEEGDTLSSTFERAVTISDWGWRSIKV